MDKALFLKLLNIKKPKCEVVFDKDFMGVPKSHSQVMWRLLPVSLLMTFHVIQYIVQAVMYFGNVKESMIIWNINLYNSFKAEVFANE